MVITKDRLRFILILLLLLIANSSSINALNQLYVVPFASLLSNESDGSFAYPYSSVQQALNHIERNITTTDRITINLYPTYYFIDETINFNRAHSHTRLTTMNLTDVSSFDNLVTHKHTYKKLSRATLSGGIAVTNWMPIGNNTYSAIVTDPTIYVNQLFMNDVRVMRTRVPTNQSDYLRYAASLNDSTQALYGFQYVPGQFDFKSLADAMVVVYHSWTESHHYIDHLNTENNTVVFTNPSNEPIGKYVAQGQRRFQIENVYEALVPNSFCFVNQSRTIYLMTDGSYDPNKQQMIAPAQQIVLTLSGNDTSHPIEDVIVDNIVIHHGAWNIRRNQKADAGAAEFLNAAALWISYARDIVVSDIEISHTGAYGLSISLGTTDINFMNSFINDTGAGGIMSGSWSFTQAPAVNIKILSNEVSYGGYEFPSGVGIVLNPSTHTVVADNVVHHQRYDGIAIYSQDGYGEAWSTNILIKGNYIHDVGLHILCDQGGIYTTGLQPGTIIHGNVIKNVFSYAMYMWGIYLDDGSSGITVSNNVIYNTGWAGIFQHYGANNTVINNVVARASLIQPPHAGDPLPDADIRIQQAENHTSWTFTRNIVYDTFQGSNHSAYKPDHSNVTAPFSNNVYYNPFGTRLLFGANEVSFSEWQASGQDNNSVIADPLFLGDVNQCDFFTISANSPAAKLGFMNITKPGKWTPGCDMNDIVEW